MLERLAALARRDDMGRMSVMMMGVAAVCALGILAIGVSRATGLGDPDLIMRGVMGAVLAGTLGGGFFLLRSIASGR